MLFVSSGPFWRRCFFVPILHRMTTHLQGGTLELPPIYFASDLALGSPSVLDDPESGGEASNSDAYLIRRMLPCAEDINRKAELWLLGDLAVNRRSLTQFLLAIRPYWHKIHLVKGDTDDRSAWRLREMFDSAHEAHYLRVNPNVKIYLSHYEHRVWKGSRGGSYHLHGDTLEKFHRTSRCASVAIAQNNYQPYRLQELIETL